MRLILAVPLLLSRLVEAHVGALAQPYPPSFVQSRIQLACSFLLSLYNPTLRLVSKTLNSNIYYIASDNLLAQKALEPCSATSQSIKDSIKSCCGNGYDLMREAILGARIPLPIHNATTLVTMR